MPLVDIIPPKIRNKTPIRKRVTNLDVEIDCLIWKTSGKKKAAEEPKIIPSDIFLKAEE